jgi:hypothetical protein
MGMDAKGLLSEELKPRFCLKRVDGAIASGAGAPYRLVGNGAHDGLSRTAHEPIASNFASAIFLAKTEHCAKDFHWTELNERPQGAAKEMQNRPS